MHSSQGPGPPMEGHNLALQTPSRASMRPEFVPKPCPRRRQRGEPSKLCDQQHGDCMSSVRTGLPSYEGRDFTTAVPTASHRDQVSNGHRRAMPAPMDFKMFSQQDLASALHTKERASAPMGLLPQSIGSMAKRQNTEHWPREFARVAANKTWQRVSSQGQQPHERSRIGPIDGHLHVAHQRGATLASQGHTAQVSTPPFSGSASVQKPSNETSMLARNAGNLSFILETKASFEGMWHQLEADIQCRERMLMDMKSKMEKCTSSVKNSKYNVLKDKKELETSQSAALETSARVNQQIQRMKNVREDLELISTDLSVQVAELNLLVQQVHEQQRVLELFEYLKEHYDSTETENRIHMDTSLQECEVKLATMEEELAKSKMTSNNLEKNISERIGDLNELEAGSMLEDFNIRQTLTKVQQVPERPSGLHECEKKVEISVLKLPKFEPV